MGLTLENRHLKQVLDDLQRLGEQNDAGYSTRIAAREAELGARLYGVERAQIGAHAPQAIKPAAAAILYALVIAAEPQLIVEFGASLGFSTIYLASAINDLGTGRVITTELVPEKAKAAEENLVAARLEHLVEVRQGDAQTTLRDIGDSVDLLFLDGSNDLYLSILELLEPTLDQNALVIADLSLGDPHHARYRDHVNDPQHDYLTIEIPIDAGVLVSKRQIRK
jgi:predicted O-methyltransferase YrrM